MKGRLVMSNPQITDFVRIYNVIEGPIHSDDYIDWGDDQEEGWVIVALCEDKNGALVEEELVLDSFDDAYVIVKHFKDQIIPFKMEITE
jgi:hypothetical protein